MWLDVIAYYVIVKDSSSECLHVVMQRQSSALSLTARERLLLCWDMWEGWLRFSPSAFTGTRAKCVSLCVRAQQSKHGIDTCFLAHKVRAGTTCLVSVFTVLVRCVLGTCDSTLWYSYEHTHTHTDRWQIKGKTRILDPLHWGYYVVQLCCWHGLWDIENQYWFLLRYHLNLLITVLTTVISSRMTVPTFRRAQGLTG